MVLQSRFSISVPNCSIQTWIFGSASGALPHGDSKAWIDADNPDTRFLTYSSARLLAKRIAVGLMRNGLDPGDRVLVLSENSVVFPAVMLGVWMAGGIFTGASPGLVSRELAFQLRDSGAEFLLSAESCWSVAIEAATVVGLQKGQVFLFDSMIPGLEPAMSLPRQHWTRLWAPIEIAEDFEWDEPVDSKDVTCTLNYSSGTVRVFIFNNRLAWLGFIY